MIHAKVIWIFFLWICTGTLWGYGQVKKVGDGFVLSGDTKVYDGKTDGMGAIDAEKPILLDFGSTTCAPCLKSFEIISVLKDQSGHAFDAYMVTREPFDRAAQFAGRRVQMGMPVLPIIYGDTVLNSQFPHYAEPHLVWIGRNGKVLAITDHSHLDSNVVKQFIEGKALSLPQKWDYPYDYKNSMVMFRLDNLELGMVPKVFEQTVIGGIVSHVIPRAGMEIDSLHGFIRYYAYNEPFVNLYLSVLGKKWKYSFPSSHIEWDEDIVLNVDAQDRMTDAPVSDSLPLYSYEMVFPLGHPLSYYGEKGKDRLDDYFGIQTTISTVQRNCLVIQAGKSIQIEGNSRSKTNLEQVLKKRKNRFGAMPIIDETSISAQDKLKIFMDWHALKDDAFLKKELERIGFKVSTQVRPVDILRFSIRRK